MSNFIISPLVKKKAHIVGFIGKKVIDLSYLQSHGKAVEHICTNHLGNYEKGTMMWREDYHAAYGMAKCMSIQAILSEALKGKEWPVELGLIVKDPVFQIDVECEVDGELEWSGQVNTYTNEERVAAIVRLMKGTVTNSRNAIMSITVKTVGNEGNVIHTDRYSSIEKSEFFYLNKI